MASVVVCDMVLSLRLMSKLFTACSRAIRAKHIMRCLCLGAEETAWQSRVALCGL